MSTHHRVALAAGLAIIVVLVLNPSAAISSAEPGATVRNVFGPDVGLGANQCRGACGGGCPDSCSREVSYECVGESQLRRVESLTCGTNKGCREHDDCLDNCLKNNPDSPDCQPQCDATVIKTYGIESGASWLMGGGPYDGQTTFEYTRQGPKALEAAYRCPAGAKRQCGDSGGCLAANGTDVDPVFDTYPEAGSKGMRISQLRTGPLCGEAICEQSATIQMTGADNCSGGGCTRFGMEFDYINADPAAPLECSTSTRGEEGDFVNDLIKLGGDAMSTRSSSSDNQEEDGMGQLLGMFAKVVASADSPEDVQISMVTLDENGNPIEATRVGSTPSDGPPPIPNSIDIPEENGHLFVPMYQLAANTKPGVAKERRVTCTHKGLPVLETVFVLL